MFFDEFGGSAKSLSNNVNVSDFGGQFDSGRYIWEASAGEAVCRGEERGGIIEIR